MGGGARRRSGWRYVSRKCRLQEALVSKSKGLERCLLERRKSSGPGNDRQAEPDYALAVDANAALPRIAGPGHQRTASAAAAMGWTPSEGG